MVVVWDLNYVIYVTGNAKVTGRGQIRHSLRDRDASLVHLDALNMRWNAKIRDLLSLFTATFLIFQISAIQPPFELESRVTA